MAKPQLVVLGFLKKQPMYGYRIGQIVEEMQLSVWAGIKLPSIYKALQSLEERQMIGGEQEVEGNNPPRKVFHLRERGHRLLRLLVKEELSKLALSPPEWWLVLSFCWQSVTRKELIEAVTQRYEMLNGPMPAQKEEHCKVMMEKGNIPEIMHHVFRLGMRHLEVERTTLKELLEAIPSMPEDHFYQEPEEN
ncbi:MAG: PadR family transcriptional regulator [Candidatus Cloacimonadota bacterium]